ncbi:hypothetical protein PARPLA_02063 [Rhodobacteraceae bacterium THAF1]|uniref:hypothetical protein n=1 Tax=Palleronia sp. THAF1 TaxID=2587842 RepID=UPI000F3D7D42|nr:hypothetical protein [Palleronia sp. THAF1]QFU07776.1 hypothetical protein FIU81_03715 [Palleronia sp. THAF1]VDC25591.1 hypothetical protein PARPLA_02063 [Rhodobacteraceae bacterium THAF1]
MSFYAFAGPENFQIAERAGLLSSAMLTQGPEVLRVINAISLRFIDGGLKIVAIVDASRTVAPRDTLVGIDIETDVRAMIFKALDWGGTPEWVPSVLIEAREPVTPLGDEIIQTQPDHGTAGFSVNWAGGSGYLTAGHVARMSGGPVYFTATGTAGRVIASREPSVATGTAPEPDVAVVEAAYTPAVNLHRAVVRPGAMEPVTLSTRLGQKTDNVRAYSDFYYTRTINGCYGQVFELMNGVARGGDSGSAVYDSHFAPIGTLVAGTPNGMSLVQSVTYQIQRIGVYGLTLT